MKAYLLVIYSVLLILSLQAQNRHITPFELDSNYSASYPEVISYYSSLSSKYSNVQVQEFGNTDSGKPLHEIVISADNDFDPQSIRNKNKSVFFINNGIHAGEPCGIDASMMLARDLVQYKIPQEIWEEIVVVIIPVYNIGGSLNRGSYSRANQNGPREYGFRGNARNFDLNRDFTKTDSENAKSFQRLFTKWNPDVFLDNHTSNGADYQYTMTLVISQKDKMVQPLRKCMNEIILPDLFSKMESKKFELIPYVNVRNSPDRGIYGFLDLPRYGSGYANLHHTLAFISEAHMLKPFHRRVWGTYHLMVSFLEVINKYKNTIQEARKNSIDFYLNMPEVPLSWSLNFQKADSLLFKGYQAKTKPSLIHGHDRLYYDRNEPYEKMIPFYNHYQVENSVIMPKAYVIPQGYRSVIEALQRNGVKLHTIGQDTSIQVAMYYISDYQTGRSPYEGHYLHSKVQVQKEYMEQSFSAGDLIVFLDQTSARLVVEMLEPQAADSYFAWNYFDGILMQKEYFSSYVFEDLAYEYLQKNPQLQQELEAAKAKDEKLKDSPRAILDFIYKRSPNYEKTHNLYPVARIEK